MASFDAADWFKTKFIDTHPADSAVTELFSSVDTKAATTRSYGGRTINVPSHEAVGTTLTNTYKQFADATKEIADIESNDAIKPEHKKPEIDKVRAKFKGQGEDAQEVLARLKRTAEDAPAEYANRLSELHLNDEFKNLTPDERKAVLAEAEKHQKVIEAKAEAAKKFAADHEGHVEKITEVGPKTIEPKVNGAGTAASTGSSVSESTAKNLANNAKGKVWNQSYNQKLFEGHTEEMKNAAFKNLGIGQRFTSRIAGNAGTWGGRARLAIGGVGTAYFGSGLIMDTGRLIGAVSPKKDPVTGQDQQVGFSDVAIDALGTAASVGVAVLGGKGNAMKSSHWF